MCIIYHNTHCSKSRETLKILEGKKSKVNIINYLENPPTKEELIDILQALNINAADFIRNKEDIFNTLNLANASENQLIEAMVNNPKLIERPIVKTSKGIKIGRPPENILGIL